MCSSTSNRSGIVPSRRRTSPGQSLIIAKGGDERRQLFEAWFQVFLIMAPAPDRGGKDGFGNRVIDGAAQQPGLRMVVEPQNPRVPLQSQETEHPAAGSLGRRRRLHSEPPFVGLAASIGSLWKSPRPRCTGWQLPPGSG